jgi:hypothetical protein
METAMIQTQGALFDYGALDQETQIAVRLRTGEIKSLAKRMAHDVVEIGGKLAEVKDALGGNGRFNDWLTAELGWSERTAYNFIAVWQKFGSANFALENVATSALYLLAAPSTPADAVEAVKQIADAGEKVTHEVAKEVVRQAKARKPKQVALVEEAEESDAPAEEAEELETPDRHAPVEEQGAEQPADRDEAIGPVEKAEEPDMLPAGWRFWPAEGGWRAINDSRGLRTMVFPSQQEVVTAAHNLESDSAAAAMGARSVAIPASAPASAAPAPVPFERPAAWAKSRIEISITLMPHEGDGDERKVLHSVRAGDGAPFVALDKGEFEILRNLPAMTREQLRKLAESLAKEQAKHAAKPAARKSAAKSTTKTKSKGAKK